MGFERSSLSTEVDSRGPVTPAAALDLAQEFEAGLYYFAAKILRCPISAEVTVGNALVASAQSLNDSIPPSLVKRNLFQFVWNTCHGQSDDHTGTEVTAETLQQTLFHQNSEESSRSDDAMFETLLRLPRLSRSVFYLVDVERFSKSDAAVILNISVAELASVLHRARQLARRYFLRAIDARLVSEATMQASSSTTETIRPRFSH